MRHRLKAAAAVVAAALVLGGCTSTSSTTGTPSTSAASTTPGSVVAPTTSESATPTSPGSAGSRTTGKSSGTSVAGGLPPGVTPQTLPTKVRNSIDKRKSVAITSCAGVSGGWGAKGTASNKGAKDETFTITIFFTTSQATTIASAVTKVTVKPGDTANWAASSKFKAADTMLCVLRGVS